MSTGVSEKTDEEVFEDVQRQYLPPLLAEVKAAARRRAEYDARAMNSTDVFRSFEERFSPEFASKPIPFWREHLLLLVAVVMTIVFGIIGMLPYIVGHQIGDSFKPDTFLDIAKLFAGVIVGGAATTAGASALTRRKSGQ
jgi:hypothetical protein